MWLPDKRRTRYAPERCGLRGRIDPWGAWPFSARRSRLLSGLDLNELLACFGGDRIAGVAAVLDVKLDGFPNVVQRFGAGIALAHASRQSWNADDISAVFFLLQDHGVAHWMAPLDHALYSREAGIA